MPESKRLNPILGFGRPDGHKRRASLSQAVLRGSTVLPPRGGWVLDVTGPQFVDR